MAVNFKHAEVEAKYESLHIADPVVHVPGGKNKDGWKGKLSTITPAAADKLFARPGQNLLKLKDAPKAKAEKASANGKSELKEP